MSLGHIKMQESSISNNGYKPDLVMPISQSTGWCIKTDRHNTGGYTYNSINIKGYQYLYIRWRGYAYYYERNPKSHIGCWIEVTMANQRIYYWNWATHRYSGQSVRPWDDAKYVTGNYNGTTRISLKNAPLSGRLCIQINCDANYKSRKDDFYYDWEAQYSQYFYDGTVRLGDVYYGVGYVTLSNKLR